MRQPPSPTLAPHGKLGPLSPRHPAGLIPSGELWLPRPSLTACVRAAIARNTVGHTLSDAQRINRFPASPLCSLSWWFEGRSEALVAERPDAMPTEHSPREAYPGRWVLAEKSNYPVDAATVQLFHISPDAVWETELTEIPLTEINRVDFGGDYEEALFLAAR